MITFSKRSHWFFQQPNELVLAKTKCALTLKGRSGSCRDIGFHFQEDWLVVSFNGKDCIFPVEGLELVLLLKRNRRRSLGCS